MLEKSILLGVTRFLREIVVFNYGIILLSRKLICFSISGECLNLVFKITIQIES